MAEGLTFGKVVKGVVLGTLAVGAVAVGFDNIGESIIGAASDEKTVTGVMEAAQGMGTSTPEAVEQALEAANNDNVAVFSVLDTDIQQKIIDKTATATEVAENYDANSLSNKIGGYFNLASDKAAWLLEGAAEKVGITNDVTHAAFEAENFQKIGYDNAVTGVYDVAADIGGTAKEAVMGIPEAAGHIFDEHKVATATAAVVAGAGTLALTSRNQGTHTAKVNAERGKPSNMSQVASTAGTAARRTAGLGVDLIKTAGNTVGGVASGVNHAVRG